MPRTMRTPALLLAGVMSICPALAAPAFAQSGDAYAYQRSGSGGEAYSYRGETRVDGAEPLAPGRGQVNCQGYCLPPGYVIEDPGASGYPLPPAGPGDAGGGYVGDAAYQDAEVHTGGPLYAYREDRYGARREVYEDRGGYSWGYEARGDWERREAYDERDGDGRRDRCRPEYDRQGRVLDSCGEIRLSDSFFWGGGGVGPEYIDAGGGGGGGGGGYAEAGAGATAYASARASVGVSIRTGGRRGHGGGKPHGGCGCKH